MQFGFFLVRILEVGWSEQQWENARGFLSCCLFAMMPGAFRSGELRNTDVLSKLSVWRLPDHMKSARCLHKTACKFQEGYLNRKESIWSIWCPCQMQTTMHNSTEVWSKCNQDSYIYHKCKTIQTSVSYQHLFSVHIHFMECKCISSYLKKCHSLFSRSKLM